MYNNAFNVFGAQAEVDRINAEINNLEKRRSQIQQPLQQSPTNLTQNFQLAPSRDVIRYASSIDEVNRDYVLGDTPYFSKDMSVVWIKNVKGEIRTYELTEIVPKDDKDMQIELLQAQLDELRKEVKKNATNVTNADAREDTTNTTRNDEEPRTTIEDEKPTSVQRVSTSKKR